jgi:filamentous hemagglutinin family protein
MTLAALFKLGCLSSTLCLLLGQGATAQIRSDNTLPQNSAVTRQGNTTVIRRGTQRGGNLFHSFERFSVPRNRSASFQEVDSGTERIFVRVTGSRPSLIDGLLEVRQQNGAISRADLFFLNPNGIQFGNRARLNLGGSLIASTANQIQFVDGFRYGAVNPSVNPLLTVQVPIGLQVGPRSGPIQNQANLQVDPGQTLGFVGGEIGLAGGSLAAPSGRIELAAMENVDLENTNLESIDVALFPVGAGWRLGPIQLGNLTEIQLSRGAVVSASGEQGGDLQIQGGRIRFSQGSRAEANALRRGRAGRLDILAERLELTGGLPSDPNQRTELRSEVDQQATGETGRLRISTQQLVLRDGAQISTGTYGTGQGVDLTVVATDRVELSGGTRLYPSGLFARSNRAATGRGGNLTITTRRLSLRDGAQISTDTLGSGDAGNITVNAAESVAVIGRNPANLNSSRSASGLFAQVRRNASGNGGDLMLRTGRLTLEAGAQISSNTFGLGRAGTIQIEARDSVWVSGRAAVERDDNISGVLVSAERGASGNANRLIVTTPQLTVAAGARISADNFGAGDRGGIVQLNVEQLTLNRGEINATTVSGQGGIIRLSTDRLLMQDRSQLTARADNRANGGNLSIDAASGFVIAAPNQDNNILASADRGRGGNIRIDASGIIGLAERRNNSFTSDIDASSNFGVSGTVIINSPEINPDPSPPELPAAPIQSELAQGCQVEGGRATAAFFNSGRGGMPTTPYEALSSSDVLADLRLPDAPTPTPLVEAQNWMQTQDGRVVLVASRAETSCVLRSAE